jgi:hypothetical protein
VRFKISRASHPFQAPDAPCEGAVRVKTSSDGWSDWEIEINDFDALIALARREGPLIFGVGAKRGDITIYDGYVE